MKTYFLLTILLLPLMFTGCSSGSGGACVGESISSLPTDDYCDNGWDENECVSYDREYISGSSCEDLGFTKSCPTEGATLRYPEYACLY